MGLGMVLVIMLMGPIGRLMWNERLSYPASSPLNLPPPWAPGFEQSELGTVPPSQSTSSSSTASSAPTVQAVATPGGDASGGSSVTGGNPFKSQATTNSATPSGGSMTGGNPLKTQPTTNSAASGGSSMTGGNPLKAQQSAASSVQPTPQAGKKVGAAAYSRFGIPSWDHPLGTESSGRDMLAVLLVGAPRSLRVGLIAATIGMLIGILLGFSAGYLGGWVDTVVRTLSDSIVVIPSLAVLIVIGAYVKVLSIENMALLLALFAWPGPTRYLRAQVLTMRERGYVNMARISGASTFDIMFKEMMPNMLPYIAASYTGNVSGAILAATGLEVLGLGPTRIPTLGMTIYYAISAAAILRGMWWWWGIPIAALIVIFSGLFLMTVGLDEIANPRLRGAKPQ
jgi:peptide/nickel transport system permease protein